MQQFYQRYILPNVNKNRCGSFSLCWLLMLMLIADASDDFVLSQLQVLHWGKLRTKINSQLCTFFSLTPTLETSHKHFKHQCLIEEWWKVYYRHLLFMWFVIDHVFHVFSVHSLTSLPVTYFITNCNAMSSF